MRCWAACLPVSVSVAISKFHPNEYIEEAYAEGQRIFGESHEQELARKVASLPEDIEWHFIGHLQTNKVKYIAPYISMIESVDSLKLLKEIEKQAAKHNRVVKVLLELHLAEEDTKSGLSLDACRELLEAGEWRGDEACADLWHHHDGHLIQTMSSRLLRSLMRLPSSLMR